jgi:cytoskeletal protein CcmA (bactofilin family)
MESRDATTATPGVPLVAEGGSFEGSVMCSGDFRLDGEVLGEVRAVGPLTVGEGARVQGGVEADALVLLGRVEGPARVRGRAALGPRAHLQGDLEAERLEISEGARIDGRVQMRRAGS